MAGRAHAQRTAVPKQCPGSAPSYDSCFTRPAYRTQQARTTRARFATWLTEVTSRLAVECGVSRVLSPTGESYVTPRFPPPAVHAGCVYLARGPLEHSTR